MSELTLMEKQKLVSGGAGAAEAAAAFKLC